MTIYKGLISKRGEIMSLTEDDTEIDETYKIMSTPESRYPDIIYVKATEKAAAEKQVAEVLEKWVAENPV